MKKSLIVTIASLSLFCIAPLAHAAHPLISDDTGTQGEAGFQLEILSEFASDKEVSGRTTVKQTARELAVAFSYGINDTMDLVLGLPYQWIDVKEDGASEADADGFADLAMELKWRFYEQGDLSFALKPGFTLPTGDEDNGLGSGRCTYTLYFIATGQIEPWMLHANAGYMRNENKLDERENLWHLSLAAEVEIFSKTKLVANIGTEKNPDKASDTDPAFILGGIIYSVSENLDFDAGVKGGLNHTETDLTVMAGIAYRF